MGEVAVDAAFARAVRTPLDAASWVEHVPGWMSGAAVVFAELARVVPWKQHRRELYGQWFLEPRLTAEYRDLREAPQPLRAAAAALSRHYGVRYDSLAARRRRVLAASRMLAAAQDTIADVAQACGYADHSAFTRQFRAVTGMTPRAFRKAAPP